ncbi:Flp pilus assembly protein CpaB [Glaciimonas sp. PCH181]|uniref:Flp pilus assembly protein CpaB n=1 Tax=Glaciimonas sp. PCH181 TaxID=2133943 RepID=UPI000D3A859A|nr:Flp pilus assembly protein CpaB [Glaciimonas sp. PCH181]PUA19811.1 Flp pilus assembly protein CpaB [Glaciimonas sp. PCH181]
MNLTKIIASILVIAALVLAFAAWWLGRSPPVAAVAAASTEVATYPVVVALHSLDAGKEITAADVQLVKLPINPAGSYTQVNATVGKIPMAVIGAGTPITDTLLASGLALKLADGERAVAVPVDEIVGAGNRVQPGDYVDVFFTLKQGQELDKTQSRLLLAKLRVLSYGSAVIGSSGSSGAEGNAATTSAQPNQAGQANQAGQQPQQPARTAVLATPVADVNRLLLATQNGKLMLALRNPADISMPDVALFPAPPAVLGGKSGLTRDQIATLGAPDNQAFAGVELTGLSGGAKSPSVISPRRVAPATGLRSPGSGDNRNTVEVIRGVQRESVAF